MNDSRTSYDKNGFHGSLASDLHPTRQRLPVVRRTIQALALVLGLALFLPPLKAQEQDQDRYSHFDIVLERTLLKIDVIRLKLSVDEQTGALVRELLTEDLGKQQLEDDAVALYLESRRADIELIFLRSIDTDQFLDGAEKTQKKLAKAGYLDPAKVANRVAENKERFAFLGEKGIQEGDRLFYTVRGDTVRAQYVDVSGSVQMNDVRLGPDRRIALLGSYFGPGTNFRDGLLDAIFATRE